MTVHRWQFIAKSWTGWPAIHAGLAALLAFASATAAKADCFSASRPTLPIDERISSTLTNGEDGLAIVQTVSTGAVDDLEVLVRTNPALLSTRTELPDGVRPSNGNMADLLTIAAANCDAGMVGALLELGADPNGAIRGLALTYAALADELVMAAMLLQAGADPDATTEGRTTALREVLYFERPDAVEVLAAFGADVNRADLVGGTPLDAALTFGDWASAKVLMDAGANPWQVSNKGMLPAFRLLNASVQRRRDRDLRDELLVRVQDGAPIWPPPPPMDVIRNVRIGAWPTDAMQRAGFVVTDSALRSINMVRP